MCYLVTRAELQAILGIKRSKSYMLQSKGELSVPISGFGRNKLFDLKLSLEIAHRALGLPPPNDQLIESHWRVIVANRLHHR
jgi:hypothetical protein